MESDNEKPDKPFARQLRAHWQDNTLKLVGEGVPEEIQGEEHFALSSRAIVRYGIHDEGSELQKFISLHYVADDEIESIRETPTEELQYEDCLMDKPMIFDMEQNDWVETKGTINMIHDSSFVFYDDVEAFIDKLQIAVEEYKSKNLGLDGEDFSNG